ncbi:MAG: response regulator [Bacteroidota bacterium]
MTNKYLIIDDDQMTLFLCSMLIRKTIKNAEVVTFDKPEEALTYIGANYPVADSGQTILLIDTNMTTLSGWDVIQRITEMNPYVIDQFCIYVQSSSVEDKDMERAASHPHIIDFVSKPLTRAFITDIAHIGCKAE